MSKKRWLLASVVATVFFIAYEWILHGFILRGYYEVTSAVWRSPETMARLLPMGWLATAIFALVLVQIYHRGHEGKGSGVAEGARFGILLGLLTTIPMSVWTYISHPIPAMLAVWWFVMGMVEMIVAGMIIGAIYRKPAS